MNMTDDPIVIFRRIRDDALLLREYYKNNIDFYNLNNLDTERIKYRYDVVMRIIGAVGEINLNDNYKQIKGEK